MAGAGRESVVVTKMPGTVIGQDERAAGVEDLEKLVRPGQEPVPLREPMTAVSVEIIDKGSDIFQEALVVQPSDQCEVPTANAPPNHSNQASPSPAKDWVHHDSYIPPRAAENLDHAIIQAEKATDIPATHPDHAGNLAALGGLYESRYEQFGQPHDLEQAIQRAKESVVLTDFGHRYRASRLYSLGSRYYSRYQRSHGIEDLQLAIDRVEEAARERHINHSLPWAILNLRGTCFLAMHEVTGAPGYSEKGTAFIEQALSVMSRHDPRRFVVLSNLQEVAEREYYRSQAPGDLDYAIQRGEDTAAAVPFGHYGQGCVAFNLAQLLSIRFAQSANPKDCNRVIHLAYKVMHCTLSSPLLRINAARLAAQMLCENGKWADSSSLLTAAVKMLPMVPLACYQGNRLSGVSGIPALAVSVAIQAGEEPCEVLRLLEFGRGVILGSIIDCQGDIPDLRLQYRDIYNKFSHLRIQVDLPSDGYGQVVGIMGENGKFKDLDRHTRRAEVVQEFTDTLAYIRGLPGFEKFQLPQNSNDLMAMASEGPIVLFNSTTVRSDAIIVTSSSIRVLALPKLSYESVCMWMSRLTIIPRGRRHSYSARNAEMFELLLWLWDAAVEPVFIELDTVTGAHNDHLPHIWWIGVGPLAMAPFHAAGNHSRGSTRNTMSRAMSSNISTFKALAHARRRKLELLGGSSSRLLLVAMPTTPGKAPPLSNVLEELREIEGIVAGVKTIHPVVLDCPSTDLVMEEIKTCDAVHFACHGVSNVRIPSESHLLLRNKDGTLDKLTVGTISNMGLEKAQIAFLSSCGTAKDVPENPADESIHIGSGFQLAGFSHVLSTQWVSNGEACRKVAGDFYRGLFGEESCTRISGADGDHWKVRVAFHHAVRELRNKNRNQPLYWASFIHTGA